MSIDNVLFLVPARLTTKPSRTSSAVTLLPILRSRGQNAERNGRDAGTSVASRVIKKRVRNATETPTRDSGAFAELI